MEPITFIAAGIATLVVIIVAVTLMMKMNQGALQRGFSLMQTSFESLQRGMLLAQKEFERSADAKSASLRGELMQELQNNRRELQQGLSTASSALEQKVGAMDTKLENRLTDLTRGVQTRLDENVKEGFKHFEKVQEHLKQAELQLVGLNSVGQSINDLNNLLKLPHLRGSFGEATLERLLSDLLPGDCYEMQYKISPTSTERVDAVIKYPKYVLPIDSKFPREQVLALFETNDPLQLEIARKNLVEVMKVLGRQIHEKYIKPEHGTSEMALLFVPSETLYFEVIRNSRIGEELLKYKVFVVSPHTLAVTLHSISVARSYYDMAQGVEKTILEIKKARQHYENFGKKFDEVGIGLTRAQTAYNVATTHLSRYSSAVTRLTGANEVTTSFDEAAPPTIPLLDAPA